MAAAGLQLGEAQIGGGGGSQNHGGAGGQPRGNAQAAISAAPAVTAADNAGDGVRAYA
jgi:hypothetical protein